jgi:serine/threonine-protein kinase HipA
MSPGGARPKALLWLSDSEAGAYLDEAPGRDAWLLKFDLDPNTHEGEIEQAYTRMAAAMEIEVADTRLLEAAGGHHFLTRRFDRTPTGQRIHLHSFSGLTHTPVRDGLDYDDLMNLTRELTGRHEAVEQIFRRAVFNVAAGNDDDHGRNHAFLMAGDGTWRVAPAFDLTQATNPLTPGFRAGRVLGKSSGVTRGDLRKLGDSHGVRGIAAIMGQAGETLAAWPEHAKEVGLPSGIARQVGEQMPGLGR